MLSGSLARRYARAIMSIGLEQKNFEALGREIGTLGHAVADSAELREILTNPGFSREDRQKVLEALLRRVVASKTTRNFAMLLLDRDRLGVLPDIARELLVMIDEKAGRVKAVVTSAQVLNPMQLAQLKTALEKLSGKTVIIEKKQDPSLLGGVVAQVGDVVYDGSLRTQLDQMRDTLPQQG